MHIWIFLDGYLEILVDTTLKVEENLRKSKSHWIHLGVGGGNVTDSPPQKKLHTKPGGGGIM